MSEKTVQLSTWNRRLNRWLALLEEESNKNTPDCERVVQLSRKIGQQMGEKLFFKYPPEFVIERMKKDGYCLFQDVLQNRASGGGKTTFLGWVNDEIESAFAAENVAASAIGPCFMQVEMQKIGKEVEARCPMYGAFMDTFVDLMFATEMKERKVQVLKTVATRLLEFEDDWTRFENGAEVVLPVEKFSKTDIVKKVVKGYQDMPCPHLDADQGKWPELLDNYFAGRGLDHSMGQRVWLTCFGIAPLETDVALNVFGAVHIEGNATLYNPNLRTDSKGKYEYMGKRVNVPKGSLMLCQWNLWHSTAYPKPDESVKDMYVTAEQPRLHMAFGYSQDNVNDYSLGLPKVQVELQSNNDLNKCLSQLMKLGGLELQNITNK